MSQSLNITIVIANNAAALAAALEGKNSAVVEAEYGSVEVMGSTDLQTLNHHVRPERPCPCSLENTQFDAIRQDIQVVGISHMDLDTLGGIAALAGLKPECATPGFWELAAFVDTNGPHRITESAAYNREAHVLLASFWAWSQSNRLFPERDGSVADCTEFVASAISELKQICAGTPEAVNRGEEFLAAQDALVASSFQRDGVSGSGIRVVMRVSDAFTNHLYYVEDGSPADMVVAFNTKFRSVTVSVADDSVGVVCRDFVQSLWGSEAGGHPGIAGSPRGTALGLDEATRAFEAALEL
ncbi:MAG: hypothetical protein ABIA47_04270 [bacterium]